MWWIIQGRKAAYSHLVELIRNFAMNHCASKGELAQVLSPKWQSRTDSPLLSQFFQSKAGAKLRKISHKAEILLRHNTVIEAREQFAANQLHSEIFLTSGIVHHKLWFFFTFSSTDLQNHFWENFFWFFRLLTACTWTLPLLPQPWSVFLQFHAQSTEDFLLPYWVYNGYRWTENLWKFRSRICSLWIFLMKYFYFTFWNGALASITSSTFMHRIFDRNPRSSMWNKVILRDQEDAIKNAGLQL